MEGGEKVGGHAVQPKKHQVVVPRAHNPPQPSTTLSYQSEVKKTSLLQKTIGSSSGSNNRKKSERFKSSDVEYYLTDNKKWTDKARISVNKNRSKLYLDYGLGSVSRLDRSLSLSSVSSLTSVSGGFKLKRSSSFAGSDRARVKLVLNSHLQVEHASNLSWNFQVVLGIVGDSRNEFGRHKIAFFSEEEALHFVQFLIDKGATEKITNGVETTQTTSPTPTIRRPRNFDVKRPLRPISEDLQYFEENFFEDEQNFTMPTQINSPLNNSSKILRRKSTGSSDTSKSSNSLRKKSPTSSTVSISSVDQKFQRRNSMTGRFKKSSVTSSHNNNATWSTKNDNDDEYYDDETLSSYNDRLKAKKKSHNSLESEEMTSDDGCVTTPDDSDVSESDEEASHHSFASPGSYEDLVSQKTLC